jgi:hypothetical protein
MGTGCSDYDVQQKFGLLFPWCGLAARLVLREWPYEFIVANITHIVTSKL